MSENMRRELTQKLQDRTTLVEKAESLLKDGKREEYRAEMDKVRNLNGEIEDLKSLIEEQDRKFMEKAIDPAEERDKAAERGNDLMKGREVTFSVQEVRKALFVPGAVEKSVTLATGTLAQPTGALAESAVRLLLELIDSGGPGEVTHKLIAPRLVERSTCCSPQQRTAV